MTEPSRCWMQITSGRGPVECQLAVAKLAPVICAAARDAGLSAKVVDEVSGRDAGLSLSILLSVSGNDAAAFARDWQGRSNGSARAP